MVEAFIYYKNESRFNFNAAAREIEEALRDNNCVVWVDIRDIDDTDIDLLTNIFNLHPLTIEDFIMPNARPKVEKFKDYLFLVLYRMETHLHQHEKVRAIELDFCLGKNYLITVHNEEFPSLVLSKERVRKQSPVITQGADFLMYSIIDSLVDNYFPIIDDFDNRVDEMSDELFRDPTQETLAKIYYLKNELMHIRRTIGPQADAISLIIRGDFDVITQPNSIYFRNIYDNLVRLNDIVGTSRDIITSAMEAYVSVVSNRLNEIMKTLTVIATIMMPLTLIASIYGMNFKYMPEISHKLGYPFALSIMIAISVVMLVYFKRKKWL